MDQQDFELETWIVEAGHEVLEKESRFEVLSDRELLIKCLWAADYGMRNAGNLETANDIFSGFQAEARQIAERLSLTATRDAFALPRDQFEMSYFQRLPKICAELKSSPVTPP